MAGGSGNKFVVEDAGAISSAGARPTGRAGGAKLENEVAASERGSSVWVGIITDEIHGVSVFRIEAMMFTSTGGGMTLAVIGAVILCVKSRATSSGAPRIA
jgi:hypothetical protein